MNPNSLRTRLIESLRRAGAYNRNLMAAPEVILWPDPERQWEAVIPVLQAGIPELLVLGEYDPARRQGPVIWVKTIVAGRLGPVGQVPILYLPGMSRQDIKRLGEARLELQPLLEYAYTGNIWLHRNGKEWTVPAFFQNQEEGLGLALAQDPATKSALQASLPALIQDQAMQFPDRQLSAPFFRELLFPQIVPAILGWMQGGDTYLSEMDAGKRDMFDTILKEQYDISPLEALRVQAAGKLGGQQGDWKKVWAYFANSPGKYPDIPGLLREAMPPNLRAGIAPLESWPQVNEEAEGQLRAALKLLTTQTPEEIREGLSRLEAEHGKRRTWVWSELRQAPLAHALLPLTHLAGLVVESYPFSSLAEIAFYYENRGYEADQAARHAMAAIEISKDREAVHALIRTMYQPWLTTLADRFQRIVVSDPSPFRGAVAYQEQDNFVLFVDALRWELGLEFAGRLRKVGFIVDIQSGWSALPSLTPTAQPAVSPVADQVSAESEFNEFRPQSKGQKDLTTAHFRDLLARSGYNFHELGSSIVPDRKYWQAIGDIDTKGHEEGAKMVRRVDELFAQVLEALKLAFEQGVKQIRIVTDHGWLLLPGGLPKATLTKDHAETRWGRCALIKDGAKSELVHLSWRWNPAVFIAYAPGISFFKANEDYAHGGISLQECMVPSMVIRPSVSVVVTGKILGVKWVNLRCKVEVAHPPLRGEVDIRTKFSDPQSSVVLSASKLIDNGQCSLMVDDGAEGQAITVVLLDESGRIIDKLNTTVGEN